jgi:hypothetical protein
MACPFCGGTRREPIAQGYWRCTSYVGGPGPAPGGGPIVGICNRRYQEADGRTASAPLCQCGMFAIGACAECEAFTCGVHGDLRQGRFLCRWCQERLRAEAGEAAMRAAAREKALYPRGRAAGALEAAGIPTVEISAEFFSRHRSRWSGDSKTKVFSAPWRIGWIIGKLNFHDGLRMAALLDLRTGPLSPAENFRITGWRYSPENLVTVSQEPISGSYQVVQQTSYFPGSDADLYTAVRKLTDE